MQISAQEENIQKTNKSFKWTTIAEASAKIISPLMNMVLARLIAPEIFGIVASVVIVVSFAELLSEGGFARYIVQHQFPDQLTFKKASKTAFTCSLFVSLLVLLIVVLFRDPISSAVNAQGYGLLLSIASIQIPLYGLSSIQVAVAQRNFEFKRLAAIRIFSACGQVCGAILFAYFGFGAWAIVAGSLIYISLECILLFIFSKEKIGLGFSKRQFQLMWKSSFLFLLETFLTWFDQAIDVFFIGKFLGTYEAGVFKNAYSTILGLIALFTAIYSPVLISLLSKMQDDPDAFQQVFYRYQRVMSFLLIPVGFGLLAFSDFFSLVFFGEGWNGANLVIGLFGFMMCLKRTSGDFVMLAYTAAGKPIYLVIVDALYSLFIIASTLLFGRFGFSQYVVTRSLVVVVPIVVALAFAKKAYGIRWEKVVSNTFLPIILSLGMAMLGSGLQKLQSSMLWNIVFVFICMAFYFLLFWIADRQDFALLWSILLNRGDGPTKASTAALPIEKVKTTSQHSPARFNFQINGVRALLCFLIVAFHFGIRYFEKYQGMATQNLWIPDSSIIVAGFFILSGFFAHFTDAKSYVKSKFFGTYLPFAISICIIFPICFFLLNGYSVSYVDFQLNFLVLPLLIGKAEYVDGAQWYIAYLLLFDLYFFVFSVISKKTKASVLNWLMLFFGVFCFAGVFLSPWKDSTAVKIWNVFFSQRFLFVVLGYFLKRFSVTPLKNILKKQALLSTLAFVLSFGMSIASILLGLFWINALYFGLIFALVVGCVYERLPLFGWKPLQIIGTASLFIYLFHQNIGYIIISSFTKINASLYWVGLLTAFAFAFGFGIFFTWIYSLFTKRKKPKNLNDKDQISHIGEAVK